MSPHRRAGPPDHRLATSPAHPLPLALSLFVGVRLLALAALVTLATARDRSAYALLTKWDAQWYRHIAEKGYGYTSYKGGFVHSDYAFFPLFPLLERGVGVVTGLPYVAAGLVVAVVSSLLAAWAIYAVASHLYGARVGVVATVLWAALPIGLVQWMSYSESLFTALAAWSLHAVLNRRWVLAGTLSALAGLTRPLGVAVAAAVVVAAAHALWSGSRRLRDFRPVAGAVLAPLGSLAYLGWVGLQVGSVTGYFAVEGSWGNRLDGGVSFARWTRGLLAGAHPEYGVLVVVGVVALLGVLLWTVLERQPLPLLVYSAAIVAVTLATSRYFGSKPRYLMPAFPLLLPFARLLAAHRPRLSYVLLGTVVVGSAVFGAVWLLTPGAP
jgi:hypothetical protein